MAEQGGHVINKARKIVKAYSFSLSGAGTTLVDWNRDDLSGVAVLIAEVKLTAAATAVGDTLNVEIQETVDGLVYNTRGRFAPFVGNVAVSTAAPIRQRMNILSHDQLQITEDVYYDTGGVSGSDIAPATVRGGPFIGFYRDAAGRHPGMRFAFIIAQTSAASFAGVCDVWAMSRV